MVTLIVTITVIAIITVIAVAVVMATAIAIAIIVTVVSHSYSNNLSKKCKVRKDTHSRGLGFFVLWFHFILYFACKCLRNINSNLDRKKRSQIPEAYFTAEIT